MNVTPTPTTTPKPTITQIPGATPTATVPATPENPLPAELVGTWFTGHAPLNDFYNPETKVVSLLHGTL